MSEPQRDDDELFTPTLAGERRLERAEGSRPWQLGSQLYVSVLGGPVAAGLMGVLNGRRLGLAPRRLALIAGIALVALAVAIGVIAWLGTDENSPVRPVLIVAGGAAYILIRELQKDADRRYAAGAGRNRDDAYDSLWGPGIAIAVGGGVVAGLIVVGVTA